MKLRTASEARQWLNQQGLSVTAFSIKHNLDRNTCYHILSGVKKGKRGLSHACALALGMTTSNR
ncbi:DNA-binding protein [Pseudomonas syringae]|uniref:DNA-binding protein n=1 Tax=Pseudomonas syringae TaxID=317 RepID=UPI0011D0F4E4|nr:DNA-binding protein [Pseudomonas syringae]